METSVPIRITEMSIDDYAEVAALWRICEGVGFSASDSRDGIARLLARNPHLSHVARTESGELVGAILGSHDGMRAYLRHLAVAHAHRRHGIGRALVERCLARFTPLGLLKCMLFVFPDNAAANGFWMRLGWRERPDLHAMQRALEPQAPEAPASRRPPRE